MKDLMASYRLVRAALGSKEKARLWFTTENPLLGSVVPLYMFKIGRGAKALKVIKNLVEGNIA